MNVSHGYSQPTRSQYDDVTAAHAAHVEALTQLLAEQTERARIAEAKLAAVRAQVPVVVHAPCGSLARDIRVGEPIEVVYWHETVRLIDGDA